MGTYWDRQPASRIIKIQNLPWSGTGVTVSTNFSPQTYQIRICSQIAGWFTIDASSSTAVAYFTQPSTAGGTGAFLPNSTVGGEYFTVTPGQVLLWTSTSTSSASFVSLQEMA